MTEETYNYEAFRRPMVQEDMGFRGGPRPGEPAPGLRPAHGRRRPILPQRPPWLAAGADRVRLDHVTDDPGGQAWPRSSV